LVRLHADVYFELSDALARISFSIYDHSQLLRHRAGELMAEDVTNTEGLPPSVILNMKLESIFMPHARAQRDDFYGKSKRFVHYTSADNALKIIRTRAFDEKVESLIVDSHDGANRIQDPHWCKGGQS